MNSTIIKSMRLPFLILTPVCVFLGLSLVITDQIPIDILLLVLTLLGALLAHISVNTLNEYYDFKSGLDFNTKRTDFSGGSGALPQAPHMAKTVFYVGVLSLIGALLIGTFFLWHFGLGIVPLALAATVIVIAYTPWITKQALLCLVWPGLGFGVLMVAGSYFAMTGEYSPISWLVGLVPFFLVNNLLLLNQYPDIHADREVGRNHILIKYGTRTGILVYATFVSLTVAVIVLLAFTGILPRLSLIALLPIPLALFALTGAIKHAEKLGDYPQYLRGNVIATLATPTLLGIAIILG